MALVKLRAPLSELTGGREHRCAGATVTDTLRALESAHPAVAGWILDERSLIRTHVNVYVNGQRADGATAVNDNDRIYVLPAITGG